MGECTLMDQEYIFAGRPSDQRDAYLPLEVLIQWYHKIGDIAAECGIVSDASTFSQIRNMYNMTKINEIPRFPGDKFSYVSDATYARIIIHKSFIERADDEDDDEYYTMQTPPRSYEVIIPSTSHIDTSTTSDDTKSNSLDGYVNKRWLREQTDSRSMPSPKFQLRRKYHKIFSTANPKWERG